MVVTEDAVIVQRTLEVVLAILVGALAVRCGLLGHAENGHEFTILRTAYGLIERGLDKARLIEPAGNIVCALCADLQTLGYHRQVLLDVQRHLARELLRRAAALLVDHHVGRGLRTRTYGRHLAVRVHRGKTQRVDRRLCLPYIVGIGNTGLVLNLQEAVRTEVDLRRLGQVDIDIGTIRIGIVTYVRAVDARLVLLVGRILDAGTQTQEVLCGLCTASCADIVALLPRVVLDDLVLPVHIGIEIGIQTVADNVHLDIRVEGLLAAYGAGLVCQLCILVCTDIIGQTLQMREREGNTGRNLQLVDLTALGGDQHNAVCTSHTVHGRCRGILQHREALDIGRVE